MKWESFLSYQRLIRKVLIFSFDLTLPVLAAFPCWAKPCVKTDARYEIATGFVDVSEFHPAPGSTKSLLIIPPTGGTNFIDRRYAQKFCLKGFETYIINEWPRPGEASTDVEVHQRFYANAQSAIAVVLKTLKTPFIGILGTSVGALHASIAAVTQPAIRAAFFIVGGLPISEVVVTSNQDAMRDLRKTRQARYHFKNDQENIAAIRAVFPLEPSHKQPLTKKHFGMVISSKDATVPYKTQEQMKEFFTPEKVIALNNDHFWAIVKTWFFHTDEIIQFFDSAAHAE